MGANEIKFKKLTINQKDEIQKFTNQFKPYSDFNFVSLIAWDINKQTEYAFVNNNLVIKMADYISGEPVVSVLGNNTIDETLELLLKQNNEIQLVPETVIKNIKYLDKFDVFEDLDNHDYIFSLSKLSNLNNREYKTKRKLVSRFVRMNQGGTRLVNDFHKELHDHQRDILKLIVEWGKEKNKQQEDIQLEYKAIKNLIKLSNSLDLIWVGLFYEDKLIGFSVNEILNNGYANCHFQKVLLSYKYADDYLTVETSRLMKSLGCEYINWEQDLGIEGLRHLKSSYKPIAHLKKYKISKL